MTHANGDSIAHDWEQVVGQTGYRSIRCVVCGYHLLGVTEPAPDVRSCPGSLTVSVRLDGDYSLRVSDIWPDGDWPDDITAEAAAAILLACRSDLASDWGLLPTYLVSIGYGDEVEVR